MIEIVITLIICLTILGSIFLYKMCDGQYSWYGLHNEQRQMQRILNEMQDVLEQMKAGVKNGRNDK